MNTSALRSQRTAAASEGQEAAAMVVSDKIVEEDKILEKVRAQQDINKIGLLVGRNHEKMIALMVLKKQKQTPQKKTQKAVAEKVPSFKEHNDKHVNISEVQTMSKTCTL